MKKITLIIPDTLTERRDIAYRAVKAILLELGAKDDEITKRIAGKYAKFCMEEADGNPA